MSEISNNTVIVTVDVLPQNTLSSHTESVLLVTYKDPVSNNTILSYETKVDNGVLV